MREPAGGFEPSTCCLRISWLILYQCPLVSMDVEYFRSFTLLDSTPIFDCVWLFIHLAVSLAVKNKRRCGTNHQWDTTQNNVVQLALEPIAFQ
jgi:hypothetical protein